MSQPPEEWNRPDQYPAPREYQPYPGQQGPYGAPPPGYGYQAQYASRPNQSNGLGVAGFVTGLLGLLLFWIPVVGLVLAVLGIVLGGSGMAAGKRGGGSGLAIAGLVCGIVAVVPAILIVVAVSSS